METVAVTVLSLDQEVMVTLVVDQPQYQVMVTLVVDQPQYQVIVLTLEQPQYQVDQEMAAEDQVMVMYQPQD